MARADGVAAHLLQPGEAQGPHGCGNGIAEGASILMQADALELGGLAVDEQAAVGIELELAETECRDGFVKRLAVECQRAAQP